MSLVDILQKLVEFPTYELDGMGKCAEFIANRLSGTGFSVSVDKLNNVYGIREFPSVEGAFLINAHFDTIAPSSKWTRDLFHISIEGN